MSGLAFDVKNACNSFVTGLHIANALIATGNHQKILLVTGEILSQAIKFEISDKEDLGKRLASLSLGDAGAAALIEPSTDNSGIYSQKLISVGRYWSLCTLPGGGSMYPHDMSRTYFEGKTTEMMQIFLDNRGTLLEQCLAEAGWDLAEIDHFFMHQVSKKTFEVVAERLGIPLEKFFHVMEDHGNIAAASIPFAMSVAWEKGKIRKGDKIMLIGIASGISISFQLLIW
jgi:acyl-CoA:acyl-CoA alkyltransferase